MTLKTEYTQEEINAHLDELEAGLRSGDYLQGNGALRLLKSDRASAVVEAPRRRCAAG